VTRRKPGTGSLHQRPNGYWVGSVRVTDGTGRRRAVTVGDWEHDAAEAKLDALVAGEWLPATLAELRRVKAEVWAEGALWAAVECGAIKSGDVAWLVQNDNPYETKGGTE